MPLHVYMYAKPPDKVVRINDAYYRSSRVLLREDLCFDTIECGNNALTLLMGFTEGQAVLHPGVVWDPDIWDSLGVLDVNHFTDLCAISSYMQV